MGYFDPDVYYQPEKFGLEIVGEAELSEPCWSFDTLVVWRDAEGKLYFAQDAGCSCPSPFEDFTSVETLARLERIDQIEEYAKRGPYDTDQDWEFRNREVTDLLAKVVPLL